MMMSLFISFDPLMTSFSPLALILWPSILMMTSSSLGSFRFLVQSMINQLSCELKIAAKLSNFNQVMILISLFMFLLISNLVGLFPFIFTSTAHFASSLAFGISFWMMTVFVGFAFKTQEFVAHLVPSGCPLILSQFMVLIESISQLIRPITLSVRLAANMTAGHLLLILCSTPIVVFNFMSSSLIILLILETAVAMIQAYVFTVLVSMYMGENN
uniref:ATP synthase subunit a n=1 Tax=Batillipes longispinosus TaxID=1477119 RepID=A0A0K0K9Z5_9BILA|nr:ATP synthase F0 subunit 6 [Batillipes longispinosus]